MKSIKANFAAVALCGAMAVDGLKAWGRTYGMQLAVLGAVFLVTALASPDAGAVVFLMGATAPFPVQPTLTNIAIAYQNQAYVADAILPRVPVGTQDFKYTKWTMAEGFTVPETRVGRKGQPNEVEFTGTETTGTCFAYGLDDPIPLDDIENAPPTYDPEAKAVERTTDLILLDREVRAAALVFDTNQYAAANKVTLAGVTQWSDFTNSDPTTAILTAMDSMILRPNVAILGQAVYTKLRTHPKVVMAFYGTGATAGVVPKSFLQELFELDEIIVGQGWVNSAKKGQAPTLVRVWGKHAVLAVRNKLADTQGGTTYGYTAQWGQRLAGSERDSKIGLRGGQRVRCGEYVKEVICANDLGYMFQNAVA